MPLVTVNQVTLNELAMDIEDLCEGFSQDVTTVTSAATQVLPMGSVVFRTKGNVAGVTWVPITSNAALVATNEFGILVGDGYAFQPSVSYVATVAKPSLLVTRFAMLKGKLILASLIAQGLIAGDYVNLKHLLKNQFIIVEDTLS